jgi:hypothetical protein
VQVVSLTPVFGGSTCDISSSSSIAGSVPGKPLPAAVDHWVVGLASGQQLTARKVVVGIGSTNKMRIPPMLSHLQPVPEDATAKGIDATADIAHNKKGASSSSSSSALTSTRPQAVDAAAEVEPRSPAAASECSSDGSDFADNSSSGWGSSTAGSAASSSCGCETCEPDVPQQQQQQQQRVLQAFDSSSSSSSCSDGCCDSPAAAGEVPAVGCYPAGRMMHAWQLVQAMSDATNSSTNHTEGKQQQQQQPSLKQLGLLLPGESVLIVGGGLTSAHLAQIAASELRQNAQLTSRSGSRSSSRGQEADADAAAAAGSTGDNSDDGATAAPISLLMRGPWRVKQFDVDVPFMGRLRGKRLQEFGQLRSFPKRLALIKQVLKVGLGLGFPLPTHCVC